MLSLSLHFTTRTSKSLCFFFRSMLHFSFFSVPTLQQEHVKISFASCLFCFHLLCVCVFKVCCPFIFLRCMFCTWVCIAFQERENVGRVIIFSAPLPKQLKTGEVIRKRKTSQTFFPLDEQKKRKRGRFISLVENVYIRER